MEDILCSTYLTVVARDAVDYGPQVGITVTKHIKHHKIKIQRKLTNCPSMQQGQHGRSTHGPQPQERGPRWSTDTAAGEMAEKTTHRMCRYLTTNICTPPREEGEPQHAQGAQGPEGKYLN